MCVYVVGHSVSLLLNYLLGHTHNTITFLHSIFIKKQSSSSENRMLIFWSIFSKILTWLLPQIHIFEKIRKIRKFFMLQYRIWGVMFLWKEKSFPSKTIAAHCSTTRYKNVENIFISIRNTSKPAPVWPKKASGLFLRWLVNNHRFEE